MEDSTNSNKIQQEIRDFKRCSLTKTETCEKKHMPTKEELEAEKKAEKEAK